MTSESSALLLLMIIIIGFVAGCVKSTEVGSGYYAIKECYCEGNYSWHTKQSEFFGEVCNCCYIGTNLSEEGYYEETRTCVAGETTVSVVAKDDRI